MKKAVPYLITFTVVLVAVIVANHFQKLTPVQADGTPGTGDSYKFKLGFGKKK